MSRTFTNGSGDQLLSPASASLNNLAAITVAAWIKPRVSAANMIAVKDGANTYAYWFGLGTTGTEIEAAYVYPDSSLARSDSDAGVLAFGEWRHVAFTYSIAEGGRPILYANGVALSSTDRGTVAPAQAMADDSAGGWTIGGDTFNGDEFDGEIADVRIYNRVLTAGEIAAIAIGGDPAAANLVGSWPLTNADPTADVSGNSNTLTDNGSTAGVDDPPIPEFTYNQLAAENFATDENPIDPTKWGQPYGDFFLKSLSGKVYGTDSFGSGAAVYDALGDLHNCYAEITIEAFNNVAEGDAFADVYFSLRDNDSDTSTTAVAVAIFNGTAYLYDQLGPFGGSAKSCPLNLNPGDVLRLEAFENLGILKVNGDIVLAKSDYTAATAGRIFIEIDSLDAGEPSSFSHFNAGSISSSRLFSKAATGDRLVTATDASSDNLQAITVCAWMKLNSFNNFPTILIKDAANTYQWFFLGVDREGDDPARIKRLTFGAETIGAGHSPNAETVDDILTLGEWQHVAATFTHADNFTPVIYRNAIVCALDPEQSQAADDLSAPLADDSGGGWSIGNDGFGDAEDCVDGLLSDVRVYNRVLTAGEIASVYAGHDPAPANLVARWKLCGGSNPEPDSSGHGLDAAVTGTTVSPDVPDVNPCGADAGGSPDDPTLPYIGCVSETTDDSRGTQYIGRVKVIASARAGVPNPYLGKMKVATAPIGAEDKFLGEVTVVADPGTPGTDVYLGHIAEE